MKRSRIQTLNLRRKTVTKDSEGVTTPVWDIATQIQAEIWPAGGQLQVETYGDRVNSMMNVKVRGPYRIEAEGNHLIYVFKDFTLCEGDGLCIYAEPDAASPDYRIKSIKPYKPLLMEVERI